MDGDSSDGPARKAWRTRRARPVHGQPDDPERAVLWRLARAAARGAVRRAKARGMAVDEAWLLDVRRTLDAQDWCCALSGVPFSLRGRTRGAGGTHLGPSPDRIRPALGYVPGNVRWVLWALNRGKGEMDDALFVSLCGAVAARHQKESDDGP